MTSGVSVRPECVTEFEAIKLRKKGRYVIYAIGKDLREIGIESIGSRESTFDDFYNALLESSGYDSKNIRCRYAVYDHEFQLGGSNRNNLVFIMWTPDIAPMKQKMVYSTSKQALTKKLDGIGADIQANDLDELSEFHIDAKCRVKARS